MCKIFLMTIRTYYRFPLIIFYNISFSLTGGDRWSRSDAEDAQRCRMSVGFPSQDNDDATILGSCSSPFATAGDNFCNEARSDNTRGFFFSHVTICVEKKMESQRNRVLQEWTLFRGKAIPSFRSEWTRHVITRQIFGPININVKLKFSHP